MTSPASPTRATGLRTKIFLMLIPPAALTPAQVLARIRARTFDRRRSIQPLSLAAAVAPYVRIRTACLGQEGIAIARAAAPEADARHCSMVSKLHDRMRDT